MSEINAFWGLDKNVGDTLTPVILEGLTPHKPVYVSEHIEGKLVMCGSFLEYVRPMDTILGTGYNKPEKTFIAKGWENFLAVRGPLTRAMIQGAYVPEIYGDPALLLPLIYQPKVEKRRKLAIIPHCIEKANVTGDIDIEADWRTVVDEIVASDMVLSSTLHGIILAEAYGVPAQWATFGGNIAGGHFKYQDYFLGTGRQPQRPFTMLEPIEDLAGIQNGLLEQLKRLKPTTKEEDE
jgi:pyruvyltransferase